MQEIYKSNFKYFQLKQTLKEEKEKETAEKQGRSYVYFSAFKGLKNTFKGLKFHKFPSSNKEEKALNELYECFNKYVNSIDPLERKRTRSLSKYKSDHFYGNIYTLKLDIEHLGFHVDGTDMDIIPEDTLESKVENKADNE